MARWWQRNIVEPNKLPLLLFTLAFVVTFLVARVVTRLIRAGRGPFKNNVAATGLHVHHAVPSLVLLLTGTLVAVGGPPSTLSRSVAAVLTGIGASLVLDEFALILHLDDVQLVDRRRMRQRRRPGVRPGDRGSESADRASLQAARVSRAHGVEFCPGRPRRSASRDVTTRWVGWRTERPARRGASNPARSMSYRWHCHPT